MEQPSFAERLQHIKSGPKGLRREQIQVLRKEMHHLDEELTRLIEELWVKSRTNPPPTADELQVVIKEQMLPQAIEEKALDAVERYRERQSRIEQILNEYPDPRELFGACFGVAPKGTVRLVRSAISLNFVLFDDRDYIAGYTWSDTNKDPLVLRAKQERALETAGCALSLTQLEGSEHLFTLARVGANKSQRRIEQIVEETKIIPPGGRVSTKGVTRLEFTNAHKTATVDYDWSVQRQFVRGARVTTDHPSWRASVFDETTDDHLNVDDLEVRIETTEEENDITVKTDTVSSFSQIKNASSEAIQAKIFQFAEETYIIDPDRIKRILIHEVQHQWNSLFVPHDPSPRSPQEHLQRIIIDPTLSGKEGLIAMLNFMFDRTRRDTELGARYQRAEKRGRDELLAFYQDGSSTATIERNLQTSVYDYFGTEDLKKLKEEVRSLTKKYGYLLKDHSPEREALSLSDEDMSAYLEHLRARYHALIKQGLRAITLLEKAGVPREQIVAKFYKANLTEWLPIARRSIQDQGLQRRDETPSQIAA